MYTVLSESPTGTMSMNSFDELGPAQEFADAHKYPSRVYLDNGVKLEPLK